MKSLSLPIQCPLPVLKAYNEALVYGDNAAEVGITGWLVQKVRINETGYDCVDTELSLPPVVFWELVPNPMTARKPGETAGDIGTIAKDTIKTAAKFPFGGKASVGEWRFIPLNLTLLDSPTHWGHEAPETENQSTLKEPSWWNEAQPIPGASNRSDLSWKCCPCAPWGRDATAIIRPAVGQAVVTPPGGGGTSTIYWNGAAGCTPAGCKIEAPFWE